MTLAKPVTVPAVLMLLFGTACSSDVRFGKACPIETPEGLHAARPAANPDSTLMRDGAGALVFMVRTTDTLGHAQVTQTGARVSVADSAGAVRTVVTGRRSGDTALVAPPGKYTLQVARSTYREWRDSVVVRVGYRDTIDILMGRHVICLFR